MKRAKGIGDRACKLPTGMARQALGILTTHAEVCVTATPIPLAGATERPMLLPRTRASRCAMPRTLRFLWLSCAAFVLVSRGTCAGDYVADTQIQHASDEGTRTAKLPLKTMAKAADLARADTHSAASGASADVQAAINAAQDGNTVVIPAGTYTWTTGVKVSTPKAITIRGAGIDQTIIIDNVNKSGGREDTVLVAINLALGKRFRLTGMTFRGMAQDTEVYNKGTVTVAGNAEGFRLDHLKFDKPGTSAIRYYGALYGVVDHCVFDLSNGKQGNVIWHENWGGHEYGDGSFAEPLALGTEKAIYLEDNTFIGSGVAGAGVVDSMGGGRFVFRHNSVTDDNLATHGTESTGRFRGVRSYEIYDNVFTTSHFLFCGVYLRGGTGVIFNNTFRGAGGQSGYKIGILTANYRSDRAYMPWGMATGTNPWDGNQDSSGYPCLDQVGWGTCDLLPRDPDPPASWPHQSSEPLYLWNNNWTPVPSNPGGVVGSQNLVIRENRDYLNDTPKPGYTPYTYPHPLVTGGIR